jgi:hypothetical protein
MTWTAAPYSSGQNLALRTVRVSSNLSLRSKRIRRTDFALIESELEGLQKQPARLPMGRELARTALGIILATMMLTTLSLLFLLC